MPPPAEPTPRRQYCASQRRHPAPAPYSQQGPDGRIQRRRPRIRHHAARPGPRASSARHTPAAVLHAWPSYLAYLISFLTIGGAWLAHTGLTDQLERIDPVILRLNLLVLLAVTFLPFPTRLTAALHNTSGERVFVTMFGSRSWRSAFWGPPWMPTRGPSTSLLGRTKPTRNCTETGGTFCHSSSGM